MLDKIGAGFLLLKDRKILVLKRSELCSHPGKWCLPGGKIDEEDHDINGTFKDAMLFGAKRELWEETKVKISYLMGSLRPDFIDTENEGFLFRSFIFDLTTKDIQTIELKINLDKEHDEWMWSDIDDLIKSKDTHHGLVNTLNILKLYGV